MRGSGLAVLMVAIGPRGTRRRILDVLTPMEQFFVEAQVQADGIVSLKKSGGGGGGWRALRAMQEEVFKSVPCSLTDNCKKVTAAVKLVASCFKLGQLDPQGQSHTSNPNLILQQ